MPRGDGTGPLGFGPMTGRGAGFCAGYGVPGYMNPVGAWRFGGRGRGRGFGFATPFVAGYGSPVYSAGIPSPAVASAEAELQGLRAQSEHLKQSLDMIAHRIDELENAGSAEKAEKA